MHFVIYIPAGFYAALAATIVEILQATNDITGSKFTYEFVSPQPEAVSRSGISFTAKRRPSQKMDVLVLLAGIESEPLQTLEVLERETERAAPLIQKALYDNALIAASCGASYLLAANGLLDGKKATISWWLRKEAERRFPEVVWDISKMVIKSGRIYTGAAAFSGLELISRLLIDLGYDKEERHIRKLLVLPPARELQSPYVIEQEEAYTDFHAKLRAVALRDLSKCTIKLLAQNMGMSPKTLARKCQHELHISPNRWLQQLRLEVAKQLLGQHSLTIQQICDRIGYQDIASFSRLFSHRTGLAPGKYRKQLISSPM